MAKVNFEMKNASKEFRDGFVAALDFLDGVESISLDFAINKGKDVGITFDDGGDNDNRTYRLRKGKLEFESTGVER